MGGTEGGIHDTTKVNLLYKIAWELIYTQPQEALEYAEKSLNLAKNISFQKGTAHAYHSIGVIKYLAGDYSQALNNYFMSLEIRESLGDKKSLSASFINIGLVYWIKSEYPKALEYYFKALKIAEDLGNKNSIAISFGIIGNIYYEQDDYPKALEYYFKALKMDEELGDINGIGIHLGNIGSLYTKLKNYPEAERYLMQSLTICDSIGALHSKMTFEQSISELYNETHQYQKAYEHHLQYSTAKDTLFNEEKSKDIGKLEARHEFEMAELKRQQEEEQVKRKNEKVKSRRNTLQYTGSVIFIVLLFISVLAFSRLSIPKKWIEGFMFFTFVMLFERILVFLDPYIDNFSAGQPAWKLLANVILATGIFVLHQFFESMLKKRLFRKKREQVEERQRTKGSEQ
ncbi:MAG: tetratricopeptide repeat protein [Deltaproteobacteria bacterium]|nr:tetratricopeptide repeat protein [Deltaproteobacteria bacterium]